MEEVDNLKFIKQIFWITFVVGLSTFFLPFIEEYTRGETYWKIFEIYVLDRRAITLNSGIITLFFLSTLLWLPIMGYSFYRYTVQKRIYTIKQRGVNYFLFSVGSMIYILPVYVFFQEKESMDKIAAFDWGYWLLLICTTILFICYLKVQKKQLIEIDLSEHLIIDDKK